MYKVRPWRSTTKSNANVNSNIGMNVKMSFQLRGIGFKEGLSVLQARLLPHSELLNVHLFDSNLACNIDQ